MDAEDTLSSTTAPSRSYILGDYELDSCPGRSTAITTAEECQYAAAQLGMHFSRVYAAGEGQAGCVHSFHGDVRFHERSVGGTTRGQPVCISDGEHEASGFELPLILCAAVGSTLFIVIFAVVLLRRQRQVATVLPEPEQEIRSLARSIRRKLSQQQLDAAQNADCDHDSEASTRCPSKRSLSTISGSSSSKTHAKCSLVGTTAVFALQPVQEEHGIEASVASRPELT